MKPRGLESKEAGTRINYIEVPFEDGPGKHSRYFSRMIEINQLNEDYKQEVVRGPSPAPLAYATLMIGKETLANNDRTGVAEDHLERMLSFYFALKRKLTGGAPHIVKRPRGRPRKTI